jgi:hypothetical protein
MPAGFNLAALKAWWARAVKTSDAHYFLLAVAGAVSYNRRLAIWLETTAY